MNQVKTKEENTEKARQWAATIFNENPILLNKLNKLPLEKEITPQGLLVEVVKFLYLVSVSDVKLSPSLTVDLGWHEFILFTRGYQNFCNLELGRFIHHVPDDDKASNNRAYLKTIQHYITQFGEPPKKIWGERAQEEWLDSQCGACNSN